MRLQDSSKPSILVAVLLAAAAAACGGSEPGPGPGPSTVRVQSVSPTTGSTFGGTIVTITGAGFAAGATVQFGGTAATDVVVVNNTVITAKTAPRAAGAAEVRVTSGGQTGTMSNAFTFVAPSVSANTPPVINSLTVTPPLAKQPSTLATMGDRMKLEASVSDAETADTALTYQWTATPNVGTFTGTGRLVEWTAPSPVSSAQTVELKLTVVERYQDADAQGLPVQREHNVQRTATVRVHDSIKEIGDTTREFLLLFSDSSNPASVVLKDFSRTCDGGEGYRDELKNVEDNRNERTITDHFVGQPVVTFAFASRPSCPRIGIHGDACAATSVRWSDIEKSTGKTDTVEGTSYVSAVYEDSRWFLCHSGFEGRSLLTGLRIIR